jgi:transposase
MSEKRVYRRFSKEFKEEAVRLSMETDKTVTELAGDLGIDRKLLTTWRKAYKDSKLNPNKAKDLERIKKLEKENRNLKMERDILKKVAAIFSQG